MDRRGGRRRRRQDARKRRGVFHERHETGLRGSARERHLVVVHCLPVARKPRDHDWPLSLRYNRDHRADAGMRDDDAGSADVLDELRELEVVEPGRPRRSEARSGASLDDEVLGDVVERPQEPVEGKRLRTERDEDHVLVKTVPRKRARGMARCSSGHWT